MLTSLKMNLQDLLEGTNRRSRNLIEWALETARHEPISRAAGVPEVYSFGFGAATQPESWWISL
jgi:hypothetical protein